LKKLLKVDRATAVLVDVRDHLFDLLLFGLETERAHRNFQLLRVDSTRAIGVEKIKRFANFLFLLLSQAGRATLAFVAASGTNSLRR
jgi:hypothetical protein